MVLLARLGSLHELRPTWQKLLPGFTWLTWPSFLLGLIESFVYAVYFGLVYVPLYNFFRRRG